MKRDHFDDVKHDNWSLKKGFFLNSQIFYQTTPFRTRFLNKMQICQLRYQVAGMIFKKSMFP